MGRNQELVKNTLILTIGKISTQFMSFFLMPLYTAVLSVEEYGIVDLVVTYSSLLLPIVFIQVDQALFRFLIDVRQDDEGKKRIISTTFGFAIIQIFLSTLLFMLVSPFINIDYKWFLLFNLLTSALSNLMLQLCRGFGDNTLYSFGSFTSAFTQIVGNIVFLLVFKMGVYGMLSATVLSHVLTFILIFIKKKIYKYCSLSLLSLHELKRILKYSLPLVPNAVCWWMLNASDRAIVSWFLGVGANGILSIGHKFSSIFITIYNIFNTSWTESASLHINDSDRDAFFTNIINISLKFFMCVGFGLIAIMPFMFPIFVNDAFGDAYYLIPIFILASIFNIIIGLYSVVYVALKKSKDIAKTSLYSGIINALSHLLLINSIGIYASAISSVIAFAVMAVYRYFDVAKYVKIKVKLRLFILFIILYIIDIVAFYSNNYVIQFFNLIFICVICIILNKDFLISMIVSIYRKIKS